MDREKVIQSKKKEMSENVMISQCVYDEIIRTVGSTPPESGGILGVKGGVINSFFFDENRAEDGNTYTPNIGMLNDVLIKWHEYGAEFGGVIHSHPIDMQYLSYADKSYALHMMKINKLERVYFPLVIPENGRLLMYVVHGDGKIIKQNYIIK